MGYSTLHVNQAIAVNSEHEVFFDARAFTPSVPGAACVYNFTGTMHNAVPAVSLGCRI